MSNDKVDPIDYGALNQPWWPIPHRHLDERLRRKPAWHPEIDLRDDPIIGDGEPTVESRLRDAAWLLQEEYPDTEYVAARDAFLHRAICAWNDGWDELHRHVYSPKLPPAFIRVPHGAHVVYRAFQCDGGELLYVGVTSQFDERMRTHESMSEWWKMCGDITTTRYRTRKAAEQAEREAIESEHPLYNVAHAPSGPRSRGQSAVVPDPEFGSKYPTCFYCGSPEGSRDDYAVPLYRGGDQYDPNHFSVCELCLMARGSLTFVQFMLGGQTEWDVDLQTEAILDPLWGLAPLIRRIEEGRVGGGLPTQIP